MRRPRTNPVTEVNPTGLRGLSVSVGVTARELAERNKCALPTVYRRLERLRERGVRLVEETLRDPKQTGPVPVRYRLAATAPGLLRARKKVSFEQIAAEYKRALEDE